MPHLVQYGLSRMTRPRNRKHGTEHTRCTHTGLSASLATYAKTKYYWREYEVHLFSLRYDICSYDPEPFRMEDLEENDTVDYNHIALNTVALATYYPEEP